MSVGTKSPTSKGAPKGHYQTRKGRGCNQSVYRSGSNPSVCTRAAKSTSGPKSPTKGQLSSDARSKSSLR